MEMSVAVSKLGVCKKICVIFSKLFNRFYFFNGIEAILNNETSLKMIFYRIFKGFS